MQAEESYNCGRCGLCLDTCPVYQTLRQETVSPRAKVQLARYYAENQLPPDKELHSLFNQCLMCGSCTAACPAGVQSDLLYMRARSCLAADCGEKWIIRLLFHLLTHEEQLKLAAKFAKFGRNHVLKKLAKDVQVGKIPIKQMPLLNPKPFRDQISEKSEPTTPCRGTVLYFTGCAPHYVFDTIGWSVVRVLTRMGYRVEIPPEQVCCGLPLFLHGAMDKARKNIIKNIELFNRKDVEAVVVDCATCGSALRKEYGQVLRELGSDPNAADELSAKVRDVNEFCHDHFEFLEPELNSHALTGTVTYHNPCHLRNAQGVTGKVEGLLEALPGIEFIPAQDADACCGGGGTFFYDHPDISHQIVTGKIDTARKTNAGLWATGCPGCRINLAGNLEKTDAIKLVHPIELVDRALDV